MCLLVSLLSCFGIPRALRSLRIARLKLTKVDRAIMEGRGFCSFLMMESTRKTLQRVNLQTEHQCKPSSGAQHVMNSFSYPASSLHRQRYGHGMSRSRKLQWQKCFWKRLTETRSVSTSSGPWSAWQASATWPVKLTSLAALRRRTQTLSVCRVARPTARSLQSGRQMGGISSLQFWLQECVWTIASLCGMRSLGQGSMAWSLKSCMKHSGGQSLLTASGSWTSVLRRSTVPPKTLQTVAQARALPQRSRHTVHQKHEAKVQAQWQQ
mmetsp:Transcript_39623/g.78368  ORF Transcript_39623/g.78368 Transcript_39623/m.78368 type:complete len:267 (+) Transcript_39623:823-1623(+)